VRCNDLRHNLLYILLAGVILPFLLLAEDRSDKKPAGVTMHDSLQANMYSNPQKALKQGLEILRLPQEDVPDTIRAFTTLHIGYILDKKGFTVQALAFYLDAAEMLKKIGLSSRCGYLYIDIGNLYYRQGDYEKATEKYQIAEKLFSNERNWGGVYTTINNFGLVEKALGNSHKALNYFKKALSIAQDSLDVPFLLAHSCQYMGDLYHDMGIRDSALFYYDKILFIHVTDPDNNLIGLIHEKAASVWLERGDTLSAIKHLKRAEKDFLKNSHLFYLTNLYQNLAELKFLMNEADSGLIFLNRANILASQEQMINRQISIQKAFIRHYESIGENNGLINHLNELNQLLEERYQSEIATQIHRMDIQNLLQDYQYRLATKNLELKNSRMVRNSAIMAGLSLLIMLMLLYSRYRNRQITHHQILEQKEKVHARELQIESMKKEQANRELICKAAVIEQQNTFLDNLKEDLIIQAESTNNHSSQSIRKAVRSIDNFLQKDTSWEQFEKQFVKIFPGFFDRLTAAYPSLTITELKICAYHRMNLDTKEIASLTALTVRAIQTSRYRLKKKLNIPEKMTFFDFIKQL
jgi:tetratricopeptide (TPR) repeat protein